MMVFDLTRVARVVCPVGVGAGCLRLPSVVLCPPPPLLFSRRVGRCSWAAAGRFASLCFVPAGRRRSPHREHAKIDTTATGNRNDTSTPRATTGRGKEKKVGGRRQGRVGAHPALFFLSFQPPSARSLSLASSLLHVHRLSTLTCTRMPPAPWALQRSTPRTHPARASVPCPP